MGELIEKFIDNLDFLHISNANAQRFIQAVVNVCFALALYDFAGGKVDIPGELTAQVALGFFNSSQIVVAIIFYFITWIFFYWLLKVFVIGRFLKILTRLHRRKRQNDNPDDPVEYLNAQLKGKARLSINLEELTAEKLRENLREVRAKKNEQLETNSNILLVFVQVMIIFLYRIFPDPPFYRPFNWVVAGILVTGIAFILIKINVILKAESKVVRVRELFLQRMQKPNLPE